MSNINYDWPKIMANKSEEELFDILKESNPFPKIKVQYAIQELKERNISIPDKYNKKKIDLENAEEQTNDDTTNNNDDTSLINWEFLKKGYKFNPDMPYKIILKELLIKLIPFVIVVIIILIVVLLFGNKPTSEIPGLITTFVAFAGAYAIIYLTVVVFGFLKTILIKFFRLKM